MAQSILLRQKFRPEQLLDCTIGICAYNEEKNIARLLDNLTHYQALSKTAEILVVCSGCTDSTPDIVNDFCKRDRRIELVLQSERIGKSSAINEILRRAVHEIIFFIPADVLPSNSSLTILAKEFSNPRVGIACGSPVPLNSEDNFSGYLGSLIWRMHNRTLKSLSDSEINTHASGELMAIRKGLIKEIPLDTVNDDAYMAVEVGKHSIVKYCDAAKVFMKAPSNLVDYIKQRRRVVFGHHSIKRATRHYPRTLETMVCYDFTRVMKIISNEIEKRPASFPKFIVAVAIEFIANGLAVADIILRKQHTTWSISTSTKDLPSKIPTLGRSDFFLRTKLDN
ncbi:MAG: glycosyltransferase [Thaumarchaeota archaeon]|nr:glycosyltransferase [Nitrososphaerota archaeon]